MTKAAAHGQLCTEDKKDNLIDALALGRRQRADVQILADLPEEDCQRTSGASNEAQSCFVARGPHNLRHVRAAGQRIHGLWLYTLEAASDR